MSQPDTTEPTVIIATAAALLDAVARDSERAVDFEVPLRCGQAANRLYTLLGVVPTGVPKLGDDVTAISAAIQTVITALSSLRATASSGPVADALLQARAAALAAAQGRPS